jgi:hypothetical protein
MTFEEAVAEVTQLNGNINKDAAFAYMKKFHRYLHDHYILKTSMFPITLVADQASYLLDTTIRRVRTATYLQSANGYFQLNPEKTTDWDVKYPAWRYERSELPCSFSVEEGYITFRGTPPTVSTGVGANMYPRVEVWASVETDIALTDTLPPDVYVDIYTTGTILKWAEFNCPSDVPNLMALLKMHLDDLGYTLIKSSHNFRPRQSPAAMYQRPV